MIQKGEKKPMMYRLAGVVMTGGWDLGTFLKSATSTLKEWGGYFVILVGVVMLIAGVFQIAKGLISHGRTQVNWFVCFTLIILGGAFMTGGWGFISTISSGGQKTIEDLGTGLILPWMSMMY